MIDISPAKKCFYLDYSTVIRIVAPINKLVPSHGSRQKAMTDARVECRAGPEIQGLMLSLD